MNDLPPVLLSHIASYLWFNDLSALSCVSLSLYDLIQTHHQLWTQILQQVLQSLYWSTSSFDMFFMRQFKERREKRLKKETGIGTGDGISNRTRDGIGIETKIEIVGSGIGEERIQEVERTVQRETQEDREDVRYLQELLLSIPPSWPQQIDLKTC